MEPYLESSHYIDWQHPLISFLAEELSSEAELEMIRTCFEFVRDEVKHSMDYQLNPVW